ncbi:flagella synthesis protein FlgN [Nitrosomonas sp. Nm51]|uniref:flagella synthesis protein FlgN n=1 Tax=Nitrosomonas sp. Nm51 TaxID=133720 RepID=UPI0008CB2C1E|nr:flagellar protein FlgN [Nitrosomonas sp. Nm51]SER27935.1 flagella synthesis protein FlgN [Nitrosomonas sp. Nm51]
MTVIQRSESFAAVIDSEIGTAKAFVEVLKKEEGALIHGRIDELDMLASDKTRLVEKLENLSKQRKQYLSFLGYSPDKSGMQLWLMKQAGVELQEQWNQLMELAKTAQQINRTNGSVISTYLQYNQRAYLALQSASGNISLYGPKGQAFI